MTSIPRPSRVPWGELIRYYLTGVLNLAFGLGCYALLVWAGLNMFAAQFFSHLAGMAFNYVTYRRHVFRDSAPAKLRFVASYAVNYAINAAVLAIVILWIASPYLAGLITALIGSVINYFGLKFLVFRKVEE